jgi:hypothetical protein
MLYRIELQPRIITDSPTRPFPQVDARALERNGEIDASRETSTGAYTRPPAHMHQPDVVDVLMQRGPPA